jgi:alanine-synthesizing transaminase
MIRTSAAREDIRQFKNLGLLGDIYRQAVKMRKAGEKLMPLNLGDPAQFDFAPLPSVREAIVRAVEKPLSYAYGSPQGLPALVEKIAELEGVDPSYVFMGNGISDVMDKLFNALAVPGTNVLMPAPVFPAYMDLNIRNRVQSRLYPCDPATWQPIPSAMEAKIDDDTSILLLNSPNNPTGAVYRRPVMVEILDMVERVNAGRATRGVAPLVVIFDEVYKELYFDERPVDVKTLVKDRQLTWVVFNGVSKAFNMPGLRIGYAAFGGLQKDALREVMYNQCIVPLCVNSVFQEGYLAALNDPKREEYFRDNCRRMKARRDLMLRAFAKMPGVSVVKPEGAFYMIVKMETEFATDLELGLALLNEEKLCTTQVSAFFDKETMPSGTSLRFVILPPEGQLEDAMARVARFLERHAPRHR